MFIDSSSLINLIKDRKILDFSAIRYEIKSYKDHCFTYCLCIYLLIDGYKKPIMITSNQSDNNYSLFFEVIEYQTYYERFNSNSLSEYMFPANFEECIDKVVKYVHICKEDNDVLSLNIKFNDQSKIHIVSAEYYETDIGYRVSGPDEMVLVFSSASDTKQYNLKIYDF